MKKWAWKWMLVVVLVTACDKNDNFIVFGVENDVELGKQVSEEIKKDPSIKILDPASHPKVYALLNDIRDQILASGKIAYKEEFAWEMNVIANDTVQNAFATPGGYVYVYTGLIKYLDHADDLAGVLGHEMAHADKRHTIRILQKQYGLQILLAVALGNDPGALAEIAAQIGGQLAGLKFSRDYETEADLSSVEYLAGSKYACNGAASFFIKLEQSGASSPPEFLSTHPNPGNRVESINAKAQQLNCSTALATNTGYDQVKASLPAN
jgi:beta-barrel assembly-enhancing protease